MQGKRVWIAFAIFGLTLVVLLAATGVAMADREPGAVQGRFQVAEPRPGDRAVYALYLLLEMPGTDEIGFAFGQPDGGQQALFIDGGARMAVQRVDDRILPSDEGGLQAASSFITTWSTEAFDWGFGAGYGSWGSGYAPGAGTGQFNAEPWSVVHTVGPNVVALTLPAERVGGDLPGRSIAADLNLQSGGFVTLFGPGPAPCGFHNGLQGRSHELSRPMRVEGQCPPAASLFGFAPAQEQGVTVLASGQDDFEGEPAVVFAHTGGAERLRLWFTQDNPYPVRMLTQLYSVDEQIKFHVLYEMTQFDAGLGEPASPRETSAALAPRADWGPADTGVVHPFKLSTAWQAALDDGALGDFLATHPQAQADSARFVHWEDPDVVEERWMFTATDGERALEVQVTRRTAPMFHGTLPGNPVTGSLDHETTVIVESRSIPANGRTPPQRMPDLMPAAAPLMQRWLEARTGSAPPQAWAFSLCDDCGGSWSAAGRASSVEGNLDYSFLGLRPDGSPAFLEELDGPYTVPGQTSPNQVGPGRQPDPSEAGWNDPRGFGLATAGFGIWTFPEPDTAARVSFAAALAGVIAYALSPLLKGVLPGAGALGLFSRIGPEQVLEHPLRSQILSLVEAEPGLHFQELARRLDTGRGTLEHHLRKLVAADIVSAQATQGFTCYFPKGKIDRRLMAAAPVLKSDGARLVLQAITEQPGRAAQDIAASTGLTPSTVNYHLKRLTAVGLVDTVRSGRFTLLTPTSIGQQALATWSGT